VLVTDLGALGALNFLGFGFDTRLDFAIRFVPPVFVGGSRPHVISEGFVSSVSEPRQLGSAKFAPSRDVALLDLNPRRLGS
jgi:hypothetical protein